MAVAYYEKIQSHVQSTSQRERGVDNPFRPGPLCGNRKPTGKEGKRSTDKNRQGRWKSYTERSRQTKTAKEDGKAYTDIKASKKYVRV